ncbi:hypothetical protein ACERZ8_13670 [Tateyamaria armeniaca]|uniref:Uncharacterized protein n=1 Tax=Tateyamaria armeniaca TaxID=2518930 RepID=A0ABW8UUQ2_9RHOB
MPIKLLGESFPGNIDEMLANRALSVVFNTFVIKNAGPNAAAKLSFIDENPKGYKIYTEFLAPDASTRIQLDGQLKGALDKIMAGAQSEAASKLDVMGRVLNKEFRDLFNKRLLGAFYDTRFEKGSPLNKICRKIAEKKCESRYGKVSVVTERLGGTNKAAVKDIMTALYMDDEVEATNACKKSGIKWKAFLIKEAIREQKGLSSGADLVKMDAKKLVICGFENVNDASLLKLMKEMIELQMDYNTRKKAPKVFEQVKKKEPKTSPIQKMKYPAMVKLLIAKGAIPDRKYIV